MDLAFKKILEAAPSDVAWIATLDPTQRRQLIIVAKAFPSSDRLPPGDGPLPPGDGATRRWAAAFQAAYLRAPRADSP